MKPLKIIFANTENAAPDNLYLLPNDAFGNVSKAMWLINARAGNQNQIPTDNAGLSQLQDILNQVTNECLISSSGIGLLAEAAKMSELPDNALARIGVAISQLTELGLKAQDQLEVVTLEQQCRLESVVFPDIDPVIKGDDA